MLKNIIMHKSRESIDKQQAELMRYDPQLPSILLCDCGSSEHQIIIHKDDYFSDEYREIVLCPHLITYRNIFKRIWVAIKYIFGYKCKYGAWDNIIVTKQNYQPLKDAVEFLEQVNLKYIKS